MFNGSIQRDDASLERAGVADNDLVMFAPQQPEAPAGAARPTQSEAARVRQFLAQNPDQMRRIQHVSKHGPPVIRALLIAPPSALSSACADPPFAASFLHHLGSSASPHPPPLNLAVCTESIPFAFLDVLLSLTAQQSDAELAQALAQPDDTRLEAVLQARMQRRQQQEEAQRREIVRSSYHLCGESCH